MSPRRFAEGTTTSVVNSQGEISGILTKAGVRRQGWMTGPEGDELMFELDGRSFRFQINRPTLAEMKERKEAEGKDLRFITNWEAIVEAEWRRRWRANVLLLKAKLEFINAGDTTLERELLPYMLTSGGQTVGELIAAGKLPMLTAGKP